MVPGNLVPKISPKTSQPTEGCKIIKNRNPNCASGLPSARGRCFTQPFTNFHSGEYMTTFSPSKLPYVLHPHKIDPISKMIFNTYTG